LVEAMMAAVVTVATLTTSLLVYVVGMMGWYRGEGNINAEMGSHTALRVIANELRQAMSVSVDGNGLGLTYSLPAQDDTGTDLVPLQSDGVARRIELDGTTINMTANGATRKLCAGVILTDPLSQNGASAYQVFTAGSGSTTRSVTVMIVTQQPGYSGETLTARNRETIYVRNVPQVGG
jgi:hypothetical protein